MHVIPVSIDRACRPLGQSATNVAQVIDELYEAITVSEGNKELAFSLILSRIICHSSILINNDGRLPEAICLLAVSKKSEHDLTISEGDITTVLHVLKDIHVASIELIAEITRYQDGELKSLLTKGLELYNEKQASLGQHCAVTITPNFFDGLSFLTLITLPKNLWTLIPVDLHLLIHSSLSWKSSISLSQTCKGNYVIFERLVVPEFLTKEGKSSVKSGHSPKTVFRENEEYRLYDRHKLIDQPGIDYVQNVLGLNCGPNTIQKIKDGELTIAEAKESQNNDVMKLGNMFITRVFEPNDKRNVSIYLKYLSDGSLTRKEVGDLLEIRDCVPYTSGLQKYLDNGKLKQSKVTALLVRPVFSHEEKGDKIYVLGCLLQNEAVQKYLDNGKLTIEQLLALLEGTFFNDQKGYRERIVRLKNTLGYKSIQKYLDNGKLTTEQLLSLLEGTFFDDATSGTKRVQVLTDALDDNAVQKYLDNGELTTEQLLAILKGRVSNDMGSCDQRIYVLKNTLNKQVVQVHLDCKRLTIAQLIQLTKDDPTYNLLPSIERILRVSADQV